MVNLQCVQVVDYNMYCIGLYNIVSKCIAIVFFITSCCIRRETDAQNRSGRPEDNNENKLVKKRQRVL